MTLVTLKVTVIIPTWNSEKWLTSCLNGLKNQTYLNYQIIVVDNGSEDKTLELVKQASLPNLSVVSLERNYGFAVAVNIGIQKSPTPYVALLNIDTIPEPCWLEKLVEVLDNAPASITSVASLMLKMDQPDQVDSAGDSLSWHGFATKRGHGENKYRYTDRQYVFAACAGAALYRKSLFNEIGYFDECFNSYFEDIDLGLREKLFGYRTIFSPDAKVFHYGHGSGVMGAHYVYLLTRNRLLTIIKNVPLFLFLKHFPQILYGQLHFFIVYKKPFASLRGYMSALHFLPQVIRERKRIQAVYRRTKVNMEEILHPECSEPTLLEILRKKIS